MEGFTGLVEFSIALAGFTSVVVVFAHKDEKWNPLDKFRITNALMASLGSAFLATVPMGLSYLGLQDDQIWKIECLLVAGYLFILLISVVIRKNKLDGQYRSQLPGKTIRSVLIISFTYMIFMLTVFFGGIKLELKAVSYFGIIMLLLLSVFAFSRLIFYRPIDSEN